MGKPVRTNPTILSLLLVPWLLLTPSATLGQEPGHESEIEGVVRASDTGQPLAGAAVVVVGTPHMAFTHGDGTFHLRGIADGVYEVRVERLGYRPLTREVEVAGRTPVLEIVLEPTPLALSGLVVTGTIAERDASEALQSVNVLRGEELQRRMAGTVASTLEAEPGVSVTSMGPATARPVIRGLSGDRVLMLEDGARVGDVSNSGSDHATALDPSSARRIEVVRGPASILYGSSALGGVINVIRDEIPTSVPHHFTGAVTLQGETVNSALSTSAEGRLALSEHVPVRFEFSGRTAQDLATPVGTLENTGLDRWNASVGSAWIGDRGHVGASFRAFQNDYGIPGGFVGGHAEGVRVEMERYATKVRAEYRPEDLPFESIEVDGAYTWYRHEEIEPPDILGTLFRLQTLTGDVLARHDGWGPFSSGAVGVRAAREAYQFGGSLFTPDTRRTSLAAFTFQEVELDPVRVEAGLRYDWVQADPLQEDPDSDIGVIRDRTFGAASGSLGLLVDVGSGFVMGANAARGFRTPDVNELYSEGPHLAAYAFEVGNPSLETEVGTGVDAFVRYAGERVNGEFTVFRNGISGYVYPRETGDTSRVQLPIYQFRGEDAVLQGWEAAAEWNVAGDLKLEGTAAFVRGTLSGSDEPLPLIPPLQGRVGIAWEPPSWFARAEARLASEQDRVGEFETPTDGYAVFEVSAGVRLTLAGRLHILTAALHNLTDEEYRNHLSRVKEIMPEAGRGLSLTYRVVF